MSIGCLIGLPNRFYVVDGDLSFVTQRLGDMRWKGLIEFVGWQLPIKEIDGYRVVSLFYCDTKRFVTNRDCVEFVEEIEVEIK